VYSCNSRPLISIRFVDCRPWFSFASKWHSCTQQREGVMKGVDQLVDSLNEVLEENENE
jgi:hypothetical protein